MSKNPVWEDPSKSGKVNEPKHWFNLNAKAFTILIDPYESNWCIWIGCIELSLPIREYLSSAVNVLTKSVKTFHVTKSDFSDSITFTIINQYDKGPLIKIEPVFPPVSHVVSRPGLSNGSF